MQTELGFNENTCDSASSAYRAFQSLVKSQLSSYGSTVTTNEVRAYEHITRNSLFRAARMNLMTVQLVFFKSVGSRSYLFAAYRGHEIYNALQSCVSASVGKSDVTRSCDLEL